MGLLNHSQVIYYGKLLKTPARVLERLAQRHVAGVQQRGYLGSLEVKASGGKINRGKISGEARKGDNSS